MHPQFEEAASTITNIVPIKIPIENLPYTNPKPLERSPIILPCKDLKLTETATSSCQRDGMELRAMTALAKVAKECFKRRCIRGTVWLAAQTNYVNIMRIQGYYTIYGVEYLIYATWYIVDKYKDPTHRRFWNPPCLWPWSENVGSLCLCGLLGPQWYLRQPWRILLAGNPQDDIVTLTRS